MTIRRTSTIGRRGFSLLEVLIALAIFLLGLIALSQLVNFGTDRALEVQFQAQAVQLCQAKLAEVAAGAVPLSSTSDQKFDEAPNFSWSLDAQQDSNSSLLWNIKVTVTRERPDGSKMETSLAQMILDPSQRGSATDAALIAAANASSSSQDNSNSSNSSNSSSSTGNMGAMNQGAASMPAVGAKSTASSGVSPTSSQTRPSTSGSKGTTSNTGTTKSPSGTTKSSSGSNIPPTSGAGSSGSGKGGS